jgi:putative addiction module component (TIGR02574 family)
MGMKTARKILDEALELSPEERADLAYELISSLDGPPDPDAEEAWAKEIERRARRYLAGESPGIPWEDVLERLRRPRAR